MSQGLHSVLDAAGPQSARIAQHWWLHFWLAAAVLASVVVMLLLALARSTASRERAEAAGGAERRAAGVVAGAAVLTTLILLGILFSSVATGRALARAPAREPLRIEVVGHQWWWEVRYPDPTPSLAVATANEIHIPTQRPVQLKLSSHDVIHSFWAPSLHGKRDLIPGRDNDLVLQADAAGVFSGQCAEFCGAQHAHMAFLVVAEAETDFQAWLAGQRQPAQSPSDAAAARGAELFLSLPCATCHSVLGTPAWGRNGPDLTHFASRRFVAAGTLPRTPENLQAWILDAHRQKPGTKMPPTPLAPDQLQPLVAYLESLR